MNRPMYLSPQGDAIPTTLKEVPRWVLWKGEAREGKWTKPPIKPDGSYAKVNEPESWVDFPTAWRTYYEAAGKYDGIGLVLNGDGLAGIDMDHVVYEKQIRPAAEKIIKLLNSYTEITPSGDGLRIWYRGKLPEGERVKAGFAGPGTKIEFYDAGRYFTVTGRSWDKQASPIANRETAILAAHSLIFGSNGGKEKVSSKPTDHFGVGLAEPQTGAAIPWKERLDLAFKSKSGADILRLWDGSVSDDHSADDLALCAHLAFWLDGDISAIDTTFRASGLMREKWDKKHFSDGRTYGAATIQKALEGCKSFYGDRGKTTTETIPETPQTQWGGVVEIIRPFTDYGNAERLVSQFGDNIHYCHVRSKWLLWSGKHWEWDDKNEIESLGKQVVRSIFHEAAKAPEDRVKEIGKHAIRSENASRITAMIDLAQTEPGIAIRVNDLDTDSWLLNVGNGTLDLRTGKLKPFNRADLITKKIEVPYDPNAAAPLWEKFLNEVMGGNQGLIKFLQKAVGYSLTGSVREQVLFFSYGSGANGKSTFIETITGMMGAFSKHTRTETFMLKNFDSSVNNDIAELAGCRMVAAVEMEEGKRLAEVLTKQATGGDTLKARYLFQEFFEFRPQFKLWLSGNHKPKIQGTDYAIWRRIRLIPWAVKIPDERQDKELPAKLKNELPGILAWAVRGCLDWQQEGLNAPPEVTAATNLYRREQDILGDFFENCVELAPTNNATVKELYTVYGEYCDDNGESMKERLGKKKFNIRVTERGFDQFWAADHIQTWIGLKVKK